MYLHMYTTYNVMHVEPETAQRGRMRHIMYMYELHDLELLLTHDIRINKVNVTDNRKI